MKLPQAFALCLVAFTLAGSARAQSVFDALQAGNGSSQIEMQLQNQRAESLADAHAKRASLLSKQVSILREKNRQLEDELATLKKQQWDLKIALNKTTELVNAVFEQLRQAKVETLPKELLEKVDQAGKRYQADVKPKLEAIHEPVDRMRRTTLARPENQKESRVVIPRSLPMVTKMQPQRNKPKRPRLARKHKTVRTIPVATQRVDRQVLHPEVQSLPARLD